MIGHPGLEEPLVGEDAIVDVIEMATGSILIHKIAESVINKSIKTVVKELGSKFTAKFFKTKGIDEQLDYLMKVIPGLDRNQTKCLLEGAYKRNSSVVFGGSRIRGDYKPSSDLDVGFGSLSKSQARKLLKKASEVEKGLTLEKTLIVPGNKTKFIPEIKSPEEFFQRSGKRATSDPKAGEEFIPSGSITVTPNGEIITIISGATK